MVNDEKATLNAAVSELIHFLDSEMNRFWTRFNIFAAVQVGALIGLIDKADFMKKNLVVLNFGMLLLVSFSFAGFMSLARGLDLERALRLTINDTDTGKTILKRFDSHVFIKRSHIGAITCCIFALLCFVMWCVAWWYCISHAQHIITSPPLKTVPAAWIQG